MLSNVRLLASKLSVNTFLSAKASSAPKRTSWELYDWNLTVAVIHVMQGFIVMLLIFIDSYTPSGIGKSSPLMAGSVELHMTNQAIVPSKKGDNECTLKNNRVENNLVMLADYTDKPSVMDVSIYDFSDILIYQYYEVGALPMDTPAAIASFFFLSFAFQLANGMLLKDSAGAARFMHYAEYSITASTCLIVMAVNFGIREVFVITGLFGLFFGMNMMGLCAELLMYIAEQIDDKAKRSTSRFYPDEYSLWLVPHTAAWILFVFGISPVLEQYASFRNCSERKAPGYLDAVAVLEVGAFISFGLVQTWGLLRRMKLLYGKELNPVFEAFLSCFDVPGKLCFPESPAWTLEYQDPAHNIRFYMDWWTILLSLFAKTTLAWLLLGPALAAHYDNRKWVTLPSTP